MAGISSKAAGKLENKNEKFQGQPFDDELGLDCYGFKWRNHDPQIGRFIQIDPLSEEYVHNSTYAFSENKVTAHIELEGLEAVPANMSMVWKDAGITSNTDPKQFVKDVGNSFFKPKTWLNGYASAALIAIPLILTEVMTGGLGNGGVLVSETNSIRLSSTTTTTVAEEIKVTALATEAKGVPSFIVDSKGTAFPVPKGANPAVIADNGKGIKFEGGKGGTNGQVSTMRVMDPTPPKGKAPGYPDGYVTYSNSQGQAVNPNTGKTVSRTDGHFPINGALTPTHIDETFIKKPNILLPKQ